MADKPIYQYDEASKRYRATATGRFLSSTQTRTLRDDYTAAQQAQTATLAQDLAAGKLTLPAWEEAMRAQVKTTFLAEAMLGRGGVNAMDAQAYGSVGQQIKSAYGYLRGFSEAIAAEDLSEAQIAARAALYMTSSTQAYERGRAGAFGVSLPAYPGDGSSECMSNDGCSWDIQETDEAWEATWVLSGVEHCPTCEERAASWNPLRIEKPEQRARLNGYHRVAGNPSLC